MATLERGPSPAPWTYPENAWVGICARILKSQRFRPQQLDALVPDRLFRLPAGP